MQHEKIVRRRVLSACAFVSVVVAAAIHAQDAAQVFRDTGVTGGFIVHVGCGNGRLTAALPRTESDIVHGLDANPANVAQARAHIRSLGPYGRASVELWTSDCLPYADNVVNLLVSSDLGKIPMREVTRVLAPRGVAYVKRDGTWSKTVKPLPKDVDEWTHYLHDASGNAVAHDRAVGPPRHVQWVAAPRHTRSHEHTPSIYAVVSAKGRIFYVADEAPTGSMRSPAEWRLVARDAYNGVLLWKRPLPTWFFHLCGWTQGPRQLQRRLVAVGDRVYVTLGFHAQLSALDAATGDVVKVYEQTQGSEEVLWHQGILLVVVREVTAERVAEAKTWTQLSTQEHSPLHERETTTPLIQRFRKVERKAPMSILALDATTGRVLWEKTGKDAAHRPLSLCATGNRVFCQRWRDVVCFDMNTGKELWATRAPRLRVVGAGHVVCAGGKTLVALSADTGKAVWTQEPWLCSIRDAFVVNGSLWLGGFRPYDTGRKKYTGPVWGPYYAAQRDLATGQITKKIESECPKHHHRCWSNKATERYILAGRRGVEFYDLQTGEVLWHSWVRGVCMYGIMPCNGLLYAPPHACGCYIAAKLTGFYALAPERREPKGTAPRPDSTTGPRLERGPAYGRAASPRPPTAHAADWPTYRHDSARSGHSAAEVKAKLKPAWRAPVAGRLTSPTVAQGRVFVASVDEHRVCALNATSGEPSWDFTAGARVDSPPTVFEGMAIFGCRDGYVYSLRASDGVLAWRARAARADKRVAAWGQLESVSPAHGSVLVQDRVVVVAAGRSSYLDGGIDLCRLKPETGEILSNTPIYSPDPETGKQPKQYGPCYMPGALSDILTSDGQHVYLRDMVFDMQGRPQPEGNAHLLTLTGFLDDSWPHRSYWVFGTRCSISTGCSGRDRDLISARIMAFDDSTIYGYGRAKLHWSNQLQDGPYQLFALSRSPKTAKWSKPAAVQVRAMVLAGKVLFVAGPGTRSGDKGAALIAISAADGAELARYPLESPPVFDGMAAANGRLYLATQDGHVLCMAPTE